MDYGPLVTEQIESGRDFAMRFDSLARPLRSAFWIREDEDSPWRLYLASAEIDDSNFNLAYEEVHRILSSDERMSLDPFQIKVIGATHRMARAILDIQRNYPASLEKRLSNLRSGDFHVEDAYIYAFPVAVAQ